MTRDALQRRIQWLESLLRLSRHAPVSHVIVRAQLDLALAYYARLFF